MVARHSGLGGALLRAYLKAESKKQKAGIDDEKA
jgi:hypothetical protein